jgi:hypothetical protein
MVAGWLTSLTAVLAGLLAGGMLLIRVVLVPFWRSVTPSEFRRWFGAYSGHIRRLMLPLGPATAVAATASAIAQAASADEDRVSSATTAATAVGVVAITVSVNEPANAKFVEDGLGDDETVALLSRWARWHDVRLALGLIGALAAARAASAQRR